MEIHAGTMYFRDLNERIRAADSPAVTVHGCLGQRYIGSGSTGQALRLHGTPGNALGAYLDGSTIEVFGNAQDATGDTMNAGDIFIHGSAGDATGYAMRGGRIFVRDSTGYRAGIHMKQYRDRVPALVIGGTAGSFLGEYQAGGVIVVLGMGCGGTVPVGNFCGTGMHGGKIYIRATTPPAGLPAQVTVSPASHADMEDIAPLLSEFCARFGVPQQDVSSGPFFVLTPDTANPYKQLYTLN